MHSERVYSTQIKMIVKDNQVVIRFGCGKE